jgi:hypothetical protein
MNYFAANHTSSIAEVGATDVLALHRSAWLLHIVETRHEAIYDLRDD